MINTNKVIYLPLDERPCNYNYPVQLAAMTDVNIVIPPVSLLGNKKKPADLAVLKQWLEQEIPTASRLIISLDMFVYGGIVPSRLHHITVKEGVDRLEQLKTYKELNPSLKIYANNLIMRVPSYDSSDEEPDYYAVYGRMLYEYGWLLDKLESQDLSDEEVEKLTALTKQIPADILKDYTGRRTVNASVNKEAVRLVAKGIIDRLILPLDDNAKYGFSAKEQRELLFLVDELNVGDQILIYPGADEVGCTLLSGVFCEMKNYHPETYVRYSSTHGSQVIPKYEDRSLNESVKSQLLSAGVLMGDDSASADFVLMVNSPPAGQAEMAESSFLYKERCRAYYSEYQLNEFRMAIRSYAQKGKIVALADVAVCNGADHALMKMMGKGNELNLLAAYAGWNTSGNTLGTVIAHAVIISYYRQSDEKQTSAQQRTSREFFLYRLVEDWGYQANVRNDVNSVVLPELDLTSQHLGTREEEVCQVIKDGLNEFCSQYLGQLPEGTPTVEHVYLPWHRTFELGFSLVRDDS